MIRGRTGGTMRPVPRRYAADRPCPECGGMRSVEVVVRDPLTIGYKCTQGHMWLAGPVRRPAVKAASPVPVLVGKTGSPVGDDGDEPPWE